MSRATITEDLPSGTIVPVTESRPSPRHFRNARMEWVELRPGYRVGSDGKQYPARITSEDRTYVVGRVHYLRHDEGMNYRLIVARLHDEGLPGSLGTVRRYLTVWRCDLCSGAPIDAPEQSTSPAVQVPNPEHLNSGVA